MPLYDTKDLVAEDMHDLFPKRLNDDTSNLHSEALTREDMKIYENITYNGLHAEVVNYLNLALLYKHKTNISLFLAHGR